MSLKSRSLFQVDWLLSNLRWLLLISVAIVALLQSLQAGENLFSPILISLLLAGAAYNLIVMLLLVLRTFPKPLSALTLVADTALAVAFIYASDVPETPYLFFGLFPIITASLRYNWWASLGTALTIVLAYVGLTYLTYPQLSLATYFPVAVGGLILLLAALLSGLVADRVTRLAAQAIREEEEAELPRLRAIRERAKAIYEMASMLSATLNYRRILEAVLDISVVGLQDLGPLANEIVSAVLLFGEDSLFITASRRLTRMDQLRRPPGREGLLAQVINTAEPGLTLDPRHDPELGQFVAFQHCRSAVAIPLRAGFESYGVVVFGSPEPDTFTQDRIELLTAVCNQAIIALQNAQLYQELLAEKERIVEVEEEARKKLARDLHDGPTQSIAAIAMRLNYIQLLLDKDPVRVKAELKKIEDLARRTTKEIRQMLFTLRPLILENQGLTAALEQYVQKLRETDSLEIHLEVEPVEEYVDKDVQGTLFYIIEEAISNARKHAHADHLWIRVGIRDGFLFAQVEDDGVGFDVSRVQERYDERGSLGMINLHERTELIGGTLRIESAPGEGTRITVQVPLEEG